MLAGSVAEHMADDDGERLDPGVPPMPATMGMNTAEHQGLATARRAHDGGRQHGGRRVHEEPEQPPRTTPVGSKIVSSAETPQVDVLSGLVDDVDHVVDGDGAEAVVPVDDGHRKQVVLGHQPGPLFLVRVGGDAHDVVRRMACTVVDGSAVMTATRHQPTG